MAGNPDPTGAAALSICAPTPLRPVDLKAPTAAGLLADADAAAARRAPGRSAGQTARGAAALIATIAAGGNPVRRGRGGPPHGTDDRRFPRRRDPPGGGQAAADPPGGRTTTTPPSPAAPPPIRLPGAPEGAPAVGGAASGPAQD